MTCGLPPMARRPSPSAKTFRPHIAFIDIGMPRLDGYEVARSHPPDGRPVDRARRADRMGPGRGQAPIARRRVRSPPHQAAGTRRGAASHRRLRGRISCRRSTISMMRRPAFALAIALSFCSMDGEAAPQDAALPKLAAGAGTSAAPFDINTIVPDSFQAMAVRIPEGLTPKIDGRLDDEVWRLGKAAGRFLSARARLRATLDREDRVQDSVRRQEDLLWRVALGQRCVAHPRDRDEARLRAQSRRSAEDHHRHLPRSPERFLLQHEPARRAQGRQHGRERPHHQLRLEHRLGKPDVDRREGVVRRARHSAESTPLRDGRRRDDLGPQSLPDHPAQERRDLLGAVSARVERERLRASLERRRDQRAARHRRPPPARASAVCVAARDA